MRAGHGQSSCGWTLPRTGTAGRGPTWFLGAGRIDEARWCSGQHA